ncbi:hypothetical protein LCM17_00675 [Cereibacter sphaeroides]|nr:hypothetical protein [Cereibacter sphaeroides]
MNKIPMIGVIVLPLVIFVAFFGQEILETEGLLAKGFQNAGLIALLSGAAAIVFHLYKITMSNMESCIRIAIVTVLDQHSGIDRDELFNLARKGIPLWFFFTGDFYSTLDSLHMNGKAELRGGKWHSEHGTTKP